jgi:hypothetical protein
VPLDNEEQQSLDGSGDAWFKLRTFGYGWTPASWEGWAVTLVWMAVSGGGVIWLLRHHPLWIVPWVAASCVVLLFVIVKKD